MLLISLGWMDGCTFRVKAQRFRAVLENCRELLHTRAIRAICFLYVDVNNL